MNEAPPLLDFLYADHERVASFLAQIVGSGSPTESSTAGTTRKQANRKGGLKLGILEGELGSERDWGKEVRLTYDPLWSNSKKLIDHFEAQVRSEGFSIGQVGILSGTLIAYDLSALTSIMNASAMDEFIANGISDDTETLKAGKRTKLSDKKKEAAVIREFIKALPLGIGFVLVTDTAHFWFSVRRNFLSLYDLDVPLKFPTHISGRWNVLGVLDAIPNDHVEGLRDVIDRNIDGLFPGMALNMMQLTGITAAMFGRPLTAHGLSPLVVYRSVTT